MKKEETLYEIKSSGFVAVIRMPDSGKLLEITTAIKEGGVKCIEIAITTPNAEVIKVCRRYGKVSIPGAFTPTEILTTWELGADIVKVFPAGAVGPKYFKDVKAPLPQVELMPTGGVSIENAGEFIKSGACAVAIGSALLDKKAIAGENYRLLTEKAKRLVENIKKAKENL